MSVPKSSEKARLYPAACGGGVRALLDGALLGGSLLVGSLLRGPLLGAPPPDPHAQSNSTNTSDNAVKRQMVTSLILFFAFILSVGPIVNMPKSEAENRARVAPLVVSAIAHHCADTLLTNSAVCNDCTSTQLYCRMF